MRRFLAVALVSVALAACSSSGDAASNTTEGKKYVDALMKSYSASAAKKSITESEARCLSEATIDASGVDALKAAKVMPADLGQGSAFVTLGKKLPKGEVAKVATAIVDANCVNPGQVLLRSGVARAKAFSKIAPAKVRCMFLKLGAPTAARQAFADSFLGVSSGDAEFSEAFRSKPKFLKAGSQCKVDKKLLEG